PPPDGDSRPAHAGGDPLPAEVEARHLHHLRPCPCALPHDQTLALPNVDVDAPAVLAETPDAGVLRFTPDHLIELIARPACGRFQVQRPPVNALAVPRPADPAIVLARPVGAQDENRPADDGADRLERAGQSNRV